MAALPQISDIFLVCFHLFFTAVGDSRGNKIPTNISILRLSVELPIILTNTLKPCSRECIKEDQHKPHEIVINFKVTELVGRLTIGFGKKSYKLPELKIKLYLGGHLIGIDLTLYRFVQSGYPNQCGNENEKAMNLITHILFILFSKSKQRPSRHYTNLCRSMSSEWKFLSRILEVSPVEKELCSRKETFYTNFCINKF